MCSQTKYNYILAFIRTMDNGQARDYDSVANGQVIRRRRKERSMASDTTIVAAMRMFENGK